MNRPPITRYLAIKLLLCTAISCTDGRDETPREHHYRATRAYYDKLMTAPSPPLAELSMMMTQFPKGGDLHHHYSSALYAETYLEWAKEQGFCIDRSTYRIQPRPPLNADDSKRDCLSVEAIYKDNQLHRQILKHWSNKDFDNHYHEQLAPDEQFFNTFGYFSGLSRSMPNKGLQLLKQHAKAENVQYLETMFHSAPVIDNAATSHWLTHLRPESDDAEMDQAFAAFFTFLEQDEAMQKKIAGYSDAITRYAAGMDDADFTLRFQTYASRTRPPASVFSGLYAGFVAARRNPLIVGVNIVGPEHHYIAMRDYGLHMRMLRFLKRMFPDVSLSLHAGELALGMVPPEGLRHHIRDAVEIAGAARIGHGMTIMHETAADALLDRLKTRGVAIEINLTSNAFILGIKEAAHPVNLYLRYGVPIVISSDDPGVSRSTLSHEYTLFASRHKPSYDTLKQAAYNSIRYSFLNQNEKMEQKRVLDQRFAHFEAKMAAFSKQMHVPIIAPAAQEGTSALPQYIRQTVRTNPYTLYIAKRL